MRVLHVVNSLDAGGMENGVANLARGLAPRGIDTFVACLQRRGPFAERLPRPDQVRVLGKQDGFSRAAAQALANCLSEIRPAVIHTHNLGALIYGAIASLGGLRRPIFHGEHSQLTADELTPRRLRQRRWLYRTCRQVHTVSEGIRRELIEAGCAPAKIRTILNGVDTERFAPGDQSAARRQLALPSEARLVGLVGRFGAYKGHATLLRAFEQLAAEHPDLHLVFAGGGGPEEEPIRRRVQASAMAARIHLTGFQADPVPVYQALDLLIIPSTNEGLSNAALEAMACGLPVLGNVGCGHETFLATGSEGIIADLTSGEKLAEEIEALIRQPERLRDLGTKARERVRAQFSLERMLNEYEDAYRQIAAL